MSRCRVAAYAFERSPSGIYEVRIAVVRVAISEGELDRLDEPV